MYLCVFISMQEFECELVHVPALLLSAMIHCGRCYLRETHTSGIRARLVDAMERTQLCCTTLNAPSHTPWRGPHMDHRVAHFMDASALCNH